MNKSLLKLENKYLNYIKIKNKIEKNEKKFQNSFLKKKEIKAKNEYFKELENYNGWIKLNNFIL